MRYPSLSAWGISAELDRLPGGHRNTVFRTIGHSADLIFKSTRRSPGALSWLLPVHEGARKCGFVVPELIPTRDGQLSDAGWICERFCEGSPIGAVHLPDLLAQMRAFHERTADVPQRPGFRSSQDLIKDYQGGDVDLSTMPADVVKLCRKMWQQVSDLPSSVIHGDLNRDNLLQTSQGKIVLLDWDECRRDLSAFDINALSAEPGSIQNAEIAWEVACSWHIEPGYAKAMVKRLKKLSERWQP